MEYSEQMCHRPIGACNTGWIERNNNLLSADQISRIYQRFLFRPTREWRGSGARVSDGMNQRSSLVAKYSNPGSVMVFSGLNAAPPADEEAAFDK